MTERKPSSEACLTAEIVAEYLDNAASPRMTRGDVEAHLAGCEDCYELFAEATRMSQALSPPTSAVVSPVASVSPVSPVSLLKARREWRPNRLAIGGATLAAAAAVWLVVFPPAAIERWWDPSSRPELRELVAAVGTERRVEGRLSGGFAWGPVPSAMRGPLDPGSRSSVVELAAARLAQTAESDRTARTLAALGAGRLAAGEIQPAIDALEAATALDPNLAFAWSDLSAAYLARSGFSGSAADVQRALDAAARAVAANGRLAEAHFNQAIALERLGRLSEAETVWEGYLRLDGDSAWAVEARTRLADLEKRRKIAARLGRDVVSGF